jgi:hypothetical protein
VDPRHTLARPEARAYSVERLVSLALQGKLRIPRFQTGLRWKPDDVLLLFDSIYRGLPIGSLLFWSRAAEAQEVRLGALKILAPASHDAWWVVDGQQRLTSLIASLGREAPVPRDPEDPFVVYFDARARRFTRPSRKTPTQSTWVDLPLLLDAARLGEWVLGWAHRGEIELTRAVFEAGARIRQFEVPLYIVDTTDEEALREVFFRVNNTGKPFSWDQVHDALYSGTASTPSNIAQLSSEVASLGMGRLSNDDLARCLLALRGLDVTQTLAVHTRRDREVLRGAVAEALPALRRALLFLRANCEVPHLRLLPRAFVIEVLTRFWGIHATPRPRTQTLLTRFVWRLLLAEGSYDDRSLRRRAVGAIGPDEETSVQELLSLVPREGSDPSPLLRTEFDARSARARLALLALAALRPRDLASEVELDVTTLFETHDARAIVRFARVDHGLGCADRILQPPTHNAARIRLILRSLAQRGERTTLASHAFDESGMRAILADDIEEILHARMRVIANALASLGRRLGGWNRHDNDRPSLEHLIAAGGDS